MIRLFVSWVIVTLIVIAIRYIFDRKTNREISRWSMRILWAGTITAMWLSVIVFFERF